jgi:hypothetical protein
VLYVDGEVALSARFYKAAGQDIGFFSIGGGIVVEEATYSELK